MNDDELMLVGPLDQPLPAESNEILRKVEALILEAAEEHNQWKALNVCKELVQVQKLSGLGLARALFLVRKNWSKFEASERFEDVAYAYIGLHRHTVDRYINVWEMFEAGYVPKDIEEQIRQRNIKDLIPIANAVAQGYTISEPMWAKIAEAPDFTTVAKIIREDIKGAEPRSSGIMLSVDAEGNLWAFSEGQQYFVGWLEPDSPYDVVRKASERIIANAGIMIR